MLTLFVSTGAGDNTAETAMSKITFAPRLIRLRDVYAYLGMDRNRFNSEVRPCLTEVPIGKQGVAFDRLDLDAWVEDYKQRSGRPAVSTNRSTELWDAKRYRVSSNVARSGTSTRKSLDDDFARVVERLLSKRPKPTSQDEPKS